VFRERKEGERGKSENGVWDVSGGGGEERGGGRGMNLNSIVLFPHWAVLGEGYAGMSLGYHAGTEPKKMGRSFCLWGGGWEGGVQTRSRRVFFEDSLIQENRTVYGHTARMT
jgi:hypothetical protein